MSDVAGAARAWPVELRLKRAAKRLEIDFDDGASYRLPAEYLRVMTPSAEDRGHGAGPGRLVFGKKDVALTDLTPIGRYAVRLVFDDGHDTGLYSWDALRKLGQEQDVLWSEYLQRLAREGKARV